MLTTCIIPDKKFTCDLTVLKDRIIVKDYHGKVAVDLNLGEIDEVTFVENDLVIKDIHGKIITVVVTPTISDTADYLLRFSEIHKKGNELLEEVFSFAFSFFKALKISFDLLEGIKRGKFPDWQKIKNMCDEIEHILVDEIKASENLNQVITGLRINVRKRYSNGVKINIKILLRRLLEEVSHSIRSYGELTDLSGIIDIISLIHAISIARKNELILEESRLRALLLREGWKMHKSLFLLDEDLARELTNWLEHLLSSKTSSEEILKEYLKKLNRSIRAYYLISK